MSKLSLDRQPEPMDQFENAGTGSNYGFIPCFHSDSSRVFFWDTNSQFPSRLKSSRYWEIAVDTVENLRLSTSWCTPPIFIKFLGYESNHLDQVSIYILSSPWSGTGTSRMCTACFSCHVCVWGRAGGGIRIQQKAITEGHSQPEGHNRRTFSTRRP